MSTHSFLDLVVPALLAIGLAPQATQDDAILVKADKILEEAKTAYETARDKGSTDLFVDAAFKLEEARIKYFVLQEIGTGDKQKIAADRLRSVNQLSKLIHDGKVAVSGKAVDVPFVKAPEPPPSAPGAPSVGVAPKAADVTRRAAVPNAARQKESEKQVKDLYKEQYAKKGPGDREALMRLLLDQAAKSAEDPSAQWVLYQEAQAVAIQSGDVRTTLETVDLAARVFDIDAPAMRDSAMTAVGRSAKTPDDFAELAEALNGLAEEYLAADQYDAAEKAVNAATVHARKANDLPMVARVTIRAKEISEAKALFVGMKTVLETLARTPEDPAANSEMGRFLCYVKGSWDLGLRFMIKGSDLPLKSLAEKEVATSLQAADRVALADGWFDLGEKEKSPLRKNQMQVHAKSMYEAVLPGTAALVRARIEKRLEALQSVGGPSSTSIRSVPVELTSLTPKKSTVGFGNLEINTSNATVFVYGKECRQYIFAHAPSTLVYDIPPGCKAFSAVGVRLDRNHTESVGSWKYIVAVDGKVLYSSPPLSQVKNLELPISVALPAGAKELQLKIDPLDQHFHDWSVWAYPRFQK